jgi:hypothetical protein
MPTTKILIPTADAVVEPALEKLYEKRPTSFPHLNLRSGRYWHPVLGFRAQATRLLQRLALLAANRRLNTAKGQALLDYVASEFDAVPETDATIATGAIVIGRADLEADLPGGPIPKGTLFTRTSFDALGIAFESAEYETLIDAFIDVNSTGNVSIPIQATRAGSQANTPVVTASIDHGITFPPLVENIEVKSFEAAGGSGGRFNDTGFDAFVRLFAQASAQGQYGPTSAASKLGALSTAGVRHCLVYDDVPTATQKILIADSKWGSSSRWAAAVHQDIYDAGLVGFGCKIALGPVRNKVVSVDATVVLRDGNYLVETTAIDLAIQSAVRAYFDDRPDWNVWNESALKSAIARAHHKIFRCSSVTVKDAGTGAPLTEILSPDYSQEQFHYFVASNAVKPIYVGPT